MEDRKELWVLNPAVTTPTVDLKTNKLWYFTSLPDGTPIKIPDDDMIHLTTLSTDGLKGNHLFKLQENQ